jgi:hypothetical protein
MPSGFGRVTLIVILIAALTMSVGAQEVLLMPPSPQANGRAGVNLPGDFSDPLSPITNPALLGLMAEHNRLMVGFFPARAKWSMLEGDSPIGYSSRAVQLGFDHQSIGSGSEWHIPLSIGVGYVETNLDLGEGIVVDENGRMMGTSHHSYERAQGLDLGLGLNYRLWQAALGFTHKLVTERYVIEPYHTYFSSDVGLYVQSPLERFFYRSGPTYESGHVRLQPFCTAAFGYSVANLGPRQRYGDNVITDPLYRTANMNLGGVVGLYAAHPVEADWKLLSVGAGVQTRDLLINGDGNYKMLSGDIHPVRNLIAGKGNNDLGMYKGFEFGLAQTFYYRYGRASDDHFYWRGTDTQGYGVSLSGMLQLAEFCPKFRSDPTASTLARHLDIRFDYSSRNDHSPNPSNGDPYEQMLNSIIFRSISLNWRY